MTSFEELNAIQAQLVAQVLSVTQHLSISDRIYWAAFGAVASDARTVSPDLFNTLQISMNSLLEAFMDWENNPDGLYFTLPDGFKRVTEEATVAIQDVYFQGLSDD